MREHEDAHEPSAAFVATLEREIIGEMRAETAIAPVNSVQTPRAWRPLGRRERVAAAVLLAIGLTVGAGSQIAYAQVRSAQEQSALEREKRTERDILAMRLQVARQERDRALAAVRAGAATRESALDAEAEVKERELVMMRAELDLAEIQLTRRAPRDELWAPKVGERDFVKDRLRLEAARAQEQLKLAEARSEIRIRAAQAGVASPESEVETTRAQLRAQREFERVAHALISREEFFRERLTVEQVTRRTETNQLGVDFRAARALYDLAQKQYSVAKQRFALGAATELDVKRAELEVLERKAEVERLQVQMRAVDRPE